MIIGEYTHTLDEKKRISLPSKFRNELGKKVIITRGLDSCLFVFTPVEWKKYSEKLSEMGMGQADARGFARFMFSGATEVEVDSAGRILISDFLRSFAEIKNKVVFAGINNRVEIWNDKKWADYKKKIEKQVDISAEKLGDIGVF